MNYRDFVMENDICMCKGIECLLKDECLRYKAKPSKLQTYFTEIQYKNGKCEYFVSYKDIDKKLNDMIYMSMIKRNNKEKIGNIDG